MKIESAIAERAKERQESGRGADGSGGRGKRKNLSQKSVKGIDTQKEAAALAGVSHDTYHKGKTVLQSEDVDEVTTLLLRSISASYTMWSQNAVEFFFEKGFDGFAGIAYFVSR